MRHTSRQRSIMVCASARGSCCSAVLLLLLALLGLARGADEYVPRKYKFETGESVQFIADTASFKYRPRPAANCSDCFLNFRLGALSELDAFGQPIATHTIPDLSLLEAEITGGERMSGSTTYRYMTLTLAGPRLPAALTKGSCPSLDSIINQAYAAGVRPHDNSMLALFENRAMSGQQGDVSVPPHIGLLGAATGRRLTQAPHRRSRFRDLVASALGAATETGGQQAAVAAADASASTAAADNATTPAAAGNTTAPAAADNTTAAGNDIAAVTGTPVPTYSAGAAGEAVNDAAAATDSSKAAALPAPAPAAVPAAAPAAAAAPVEPPRLKQQSPLVSGSAPLPQPPAAAPAAEEEPARQLVPTAARAPTASAQSPDAGAVLVPPAADKQAVAGGQPQGGPSADDVATPRQAMMVDNGGQEPAATNPDKPQDSPSSEDAEADPTGVNDLHKQLNANGGYLSTPSTAPAVVANPSMVMPGGSGAWPQQQAAGGLFGAPAGADPYLYALDGPPMIKVTFMFGFTSNKTFAYGRGRVVSAPAGSVKFNVETVNWPFCSLYNTLKLEVVMSSGVKDSQPQFIYADPALSDDDVALPTKHVSRRLHQEAFTDFMASDMGGKKAAAGLAAGGGDLRLPGMGNTYVPVKRVETAKLLVGPQLAAAIELPTYAFASDRFNAESNVSVALATNTRDGARFSLNFGYCERGLYYDPTIYFGHTADMMLAGGADAAGGTFSLGNTTAACKRGDTECVRARRRERTVTAKNAGAVVRGASVLVQAMAGLACAAMLGLLM